MHFSSYKCDKMCQNFNQIYETLGMELNARMQANLSNEMKWYVNF